MKRLTFLIITLLLGGILLLFGGCKHGHDRNTHLEFAIDYLDEVLDLTPDQKAQLETIRRELQEQSVALRESRKNMLPLFREQLSSERIDTAVVKQAVEEHRWQLDRVIDLAIDRLAEFHATLTADQRQKLIDKLEKMEKWHADRHR